jgi:hypothetical protein
MIAPIIFFCDPQDYRGEIDDNIQVPDSQRTPQRTPFSHRNQPLRIMGTISHKASAARLLMWDYGKMNPQLGGQRAYELARGADAGIWLAGSLPIMTNIASRLPARQSRSQYALKSLLKTICRAADDPRLEGFRSMPGHS